MKQKERMAELPGFAAFSRELRLWEGRPVVWQLEMSQAIALCGLVQLALRHPKAGGPSAQVATEFINAFIASIPPEFPALKQTLLAGFEKRFDVPA